MLCSSCPRERLRSGSRQQRKGCDGRAGRPFTSCDVGLPWGAATTFHWPLRPLHQGWGTEIFLSVSSFRTISLDFFPPFLKLSYCVSTQFSLSRGEINLRFGDPPRLPARSRFRITPSHTARFHFLTAQNYYLRKTSLSL